MANRLVVSRQVPTAQRRPREHVGAAVQQAVA